MRLDEEFDVGTLPQSTNNFDPLPPGWYEVSITDAEIRKTKAGTGSYIAVRYDVIGPTHQGRVVFRNLNIRNPNPKSEEIGRQQLGDLMRAIGVPRLTDTDQLIGGSLKIKLKIREQEGYDPSNDVSGFKALEGSAPPAPRAKPADDNPFAGEAKPASNPPWMR